MMEEPLLKDLCLICHTNPPRYRCPRCSLRTCSLPCSQRHKLWSQCSGIRDPAGYVRRSELMTPATIDRDFNFLVGIERHLDRAERDVEDRGIPVADEVYGAPHAGRKQPQNTGSALTSAIERSRVVVERAPKGMQRQRENQTRWMKKQKCLSWTIEWIDEAGSRTLSSCFETVDLHSAYARATDRGSQPTKRRKRLSGEDDIPHAPGRPFPTSQTTPKAVEESSPPTRHFYLRRPHTSSSSRVLIPMSPTSSIADCLYEKVILEFPTFYVLPYPPDALPAGFITENQYLGSEHRDRNSQEDHAEGTSQSQSESKSEIKTETDTDNTVREDDLLEDVEKVERQLEDDTGNIQIYQIREDSTVPTPV